MSYKKKVINSVGYSRLQTEAEGGVGIQLDMEAHHTIKSDDRLVLIPFHAVDRVEITSELVDMPDRNPYGCDAESGDGSSIAGKAKACSGKAGC